MKRKLPHPAVKEFKKRKAALEFTTVEQDVKRYKQIERDVCKLHDKYGKEDFKDFPNDGQLEWHRLALEGMEIQLKYNDPDVIAEVIKMLKKRTSLESAALLKAQGFKDPLSANKHSAEEIKEFLRKNANDINPRFNN